MTLSTRSCARDRVHPAHTWMAGTPGAKLTEVWCAGLEPEPTAMVLSEAEWVTLAEICHIWKIMVKEMGAAYGLVQGPKVHDQMDLANRIIEA